MGNKIEMEGKQFNEWTVLHEDIEWRSIRTNKLIKWVCACSCGKKHSVYGNDIRTGKSTMCMECSYKKLAERKKKESHYGDGASDKHRLYRIWKNIKQRVTNPNHRDRWYDEVLLCEDWYDFISFKEWSEANGYSDELTIDKDMICDELRISPKIYSPETCIWINRETNSSYATTKDLIKKEEIRNGILVQRRKAI
jgi:hypothetical protein